VVQHSKSALVLGRRSGSDQGRQDRGEEHSGCCFEMSLKKMCLLLLLLLLLMMCCYVVTSDGFPV